MSANEQRAYGGLAGRDHRGDAPEDTESRERAERVRLLKAQIKAGTYRADIKDIAMQLAAAMDPIM